MRFVERVRKSALPLSRVTQAMVYRAFKRHFKTPSMRIQRDRSYWLTRDGRLWDVSNVGHAHGAGMVLRTLGWVVTYNVTSYVPLFKLGLVRITEWGWARERQLGVESFKPLSKAQRAFVDRYIDDSPLTDITEELTTLDLYVTN